MHGLNMKNYFLYFWFISIHFNSLLLVILIFYQNDKKMNDNDEKMDVSGISPKKIYISLTKADKKMYLSIL